MGVRQPRSARNGKAGLLRTNAVFEALRPHLPERESQYWASQWNQMVTHDLDTAKGPFQCVVEFADRVYAECRFDDLVKRDLRHTLFSGITTD